MTLYNLRSEGQSFRITKFDSDMNIESSYLTGFTECECPAGTRPSCRHRLMFADIMPLVDTAYFWDYDNRLIVNSDGEPATYAEVEASRDDPGLDSTEILSPSDVHSSYDLAVDMFTKDVTPSRPHSPTATTEDFDSSDGGSIPPAVATSSSWRRI